jgi:hypothetical protein
MLRAADGSDTATVTRFKVPITWAESIDDLPADGCGLAAVATGPADGAAGWRCARRPAAARSAGIHGRAAHPPVRVHRAWVVRATRRHWRTVSLPRLYASGCLLGRQSQADARFSSQRERVPLRAVAFAVPGRRVVPLRARACRRSASSLVAVPALSWCASPSPARRLSRRACSGQRRQPERQGQCGPGDARRRRHCRAQDRRQDRSVGRRCSVNVCAEVCTG